MLRELEIAVRTDACKARYNIILTNVTNGKNGNAQQKTDALEAVRDG